MTKYSNAAHHNLLFTMIEAAAQSLNARYGRGDFYLLEEVLAGEEYIASAKLQYGDRKFKVRFDGYTVFACGHQITIR